MLIILISEPKQDWKICLGGAVDFILRLQSINLLVRVSPPPQLFKNPDILGVQKWSVSRIRHMIVADFLEKKS